MSTNKHRLYISLIIIYMTIGSLLGEDYICSHDFECEFDTIHCLDDEPCNIECSANYACRHLTIICPRNSICDLQCIGNTKQNQCESINITAIHSTMLIVNVSIQIMDDTNSNNNNHPKTMGNGNIYCPIFNINQTNNISPNCLINCDGNDLMKKTTIYAIDGFSSDIMINSNHYSSNWCYRSGQMQCDPNYSTSCSMNNNPPFQCVDATNPCNPITTISPTIEPTVNPSMEPTLEPTLNILDEIDPFVSETTDINHWFDEFSTSYYNEYTTIPMTSTNIINLNEMENWIQSNEFMTMIVVVGIMFIIICMAFCITCNKRLKERKIGHGERGNMEQIPGQMNQEIVGEEESIEYQYDYNYNATQQRNRFGNKWNVGEYDIVPSQPIYDYA